MSGNTPGGAAGGPGIGFIPTPPPQPPKSSTAVPTPNATAKLQVTVASGPSKSSTIIVNPGLGAERPKPTSSRVVKPIIPKNPEDYPDFPKRKSGQSDQDYDE